MREGFVHTRYGRIHYLEEGSGPPLVLLHSNGASGFQYQQVLPSFGKEWRTLAWDMPGHGESDPITRHHSIEMYAEAVVGLLDGLQIEQAAVVGDSVGGSICIALGRDHSRRARPVVISETPLRDDAEWQATWPRIEASYSEPTNTMDVIKPRFRAATRELLARWNADRNRAGAWTMVNVMRAMRDFDAAAALRELRGPAAAILGAKGNSMSKLPFYQECLGKDKVAVLPECGHFPMIDDPQLFVTEVNRLLAMASKQQRRDLRVGAVGP